MLAMVSSSTTLYLDETVEGLRVRLGCQGLEGLQQGNGFEAWEGGEGGQAEGRARGHH